jgi:hypothetical protein
MKNISSNEIFDEGAAKLGEELSKLQNLNSLILNLK